jgi:hypothetical protein
VRVRILKPIAGIAQGVSLAHLLPDLTYDIDATLGRYLVSIGAAEAVTSTATRVVRQDGGEKIIGSVSDTHVAEAADKPKATRRRSPSRKKR